MESRCTPPSACRWLLNAAGWLTPADVRKGWRSHKQSVLSDLWILVERGELPGAEAETTAAFCRESLLEAYLLGRGQRSWADTLGSPGLLATFSAFLLVATLLFSHELAATRMLLHQVGKPNTDLLFGHGFMICLALLIGLRSVLAGVQSWHLHSWKFAFFFGIKTVVAASMLTLIWIEGSAAISAALSFSHGLQILSRVLLAFSFLFSFGMLMSWCADDQRKRCPHCMRRLDLPVTLGSWGSVFEPPATERLCPLGHGALTLPETTLTETAAAGQERWTEMDESWRDMFAARVP